jgi:hypothetical protein
MNIWTAIGLCFLVATIVTSFIHYKLLNENGLKSFPYFLLFVLAGELTGFLLAKIYGTNVVFYNLFTSIQTAYYLFLIHSSVQSIKIKQIIAVCTGVFILSFILNYFFVQNIHTELVSYTFTIGCLFITLSAMYFFYELLHSDKIENYATYIRFWIILGVFIFYTCNIPYMSVYNYLSVNYQTILNAYFKIIEILAYIMYVFFIIGIIWSSKRK